MQGCFVAQGNGDGDKGGGQFGQDPMFPVVSELSGVVVVLVDGG